MIIVFSTVDTAEQEVGRAECTEAIGDDYANGAVGREETSRFVSRQAHALHSHPLHNVIELLFLWMDFYTYLANKLYLCYNIVITGFGLELCSTSEPQGAGVRSR